jgi:Protein of unknown function (DUF1579)
MKENIMKRMVKVLGMTAALALGLLLVTGLTRAQDVKNIPNPEDLLKILAENGKPSAQHQKLQPFVGDWNVTVRFWTNPSQPPAELNGTVERKWIMGGRFIQESVKGEYHGKTFEGLGLLGYDNAQKKFTAVRVCGLCGTISHDLISCDGSGTRFVCATEECCPLSGQKVQGRNEILVESKDRIVTNIYKTIEGEEAKVMEIVSTRKK